MACCAKNSSSHGAVRSNDVVDVVFFHKIKIKDVNILVKTTFCRHDHSPLYYIRFFCELLGNSCPLG